MGGRGALTLFHVRGIRIGVDYSWFLVLFLVIWWLSGFYEAILGTTQDSIEPYLLALVSAFGFFGSILLHELGHAFVALRNGVGISSITLWLFGGVARLDSDTRSAGAEFRIAAAGPLVTLLLALAGFAAGALLEGPREFFEAMRVIGSADTSGATAVLAWLTSINVLVLVFNLIPAFPLDGGRIARAIAWRLTGDRNRATRFAAALGQGFAYIAIAAGLLLVLRGAIVTGIWLALIGFILGSAARGASMQTKFARRIEGITVADVMDAHPVSIPEDASVEQALDEYFLRYHWPWFPVVDAAQRLAGLIQREAADSVPEPSRSSSTIGPLVTRDSEGPVSVRDSEPIESLIGNRNLRRFGALPAIDADGRLSGIVSAEEVGRALQSAMREPAA
ncbi:site-2 protease family protein [Thermoleophilia bacterium SCSIO 60948]|nr:site-2 protease family protein [Thermoleophilia bacterium SCSIO 60948]